MYNIGANPSFCVAHHFDICSTSNWQRDGFTKILHMFKCYPNLNFFNVIHCKHDDGKLNIVIKNPIELPILVVPLTTKYVGGWWLEVGPPMNDFFASKLLWIHGVTIHNNDSKNCSWITTKIRFRHPIHIYITKKKLWKTHLSSIVGVHVTHLLIFQNYAKKSSIHDW
jgi:hypothetical protein